MANDLDFTTATYSTTAMIPDADEELTSQWMRNIVQNIGRSAGGWGTLIATNTTVATLGTGYAYLTGFNHPPSLMIWCYEPNAGTANIRVGPWMNAYTPAGESGRVVGKQVQWSYASGTGTIYLQVYSHPHRGGIFPTNANFNQADHGTWIYHYRGV